MEDAVGKENMNKTYCLSFLKQVFKSDFICIDIFPACMSVYQRMPIIHRGQNRESASPGTGVTGSC